MEKDQKKPDECCPMPSTERKSREEAAGEEACRCKEVSKRSFPELLKLMLKDLAFWRKTK